MTATYRYRRSPHLLLRWSGDAPVLLQADSLDEFRVTADVVELLSHLTGWTSVDDLHGCDVPVGPELLDVLHRAGVLERSDAPAAATSWDPLELAVHRRTAVPGVPTPATDDRPVPVEPVGPLGRESSTLPGTLAEVLQDRRTRRRYATGPLDVDVLRALLRHAAGPVEVRGDLTLWPFAAAGGLSELAIHVVANDVAGLSDGAWRHGTDGMLHRVRHRDDHQDRLNAEMHDATGGQLSRDPPAILLITGRMERMTTKYGHVALSLVYKNVGCLMQTLYLVATALGLAPCAVGGGKDHGWWLGLDPLREPQVGCFLVGPREVAS